MSRTARLALICLCAGSVFASAQVDDRSGHFDAARGRNLLNYPPDRQADLQHMRLEMTIADMNAPRFDAIATIRLTPIGKPLASLDLDAVNLVVSTITSPGRRVAFVTDPEHLRLTFDPPVPLGEAAEVAIAYSASDPAPGMVWTPESAFHPGRPAQLHTLGQANWNRYWFPCRDFPSEFLTTELIVAVPKGFEVISNGRLLQRERGWLDADRSRELEIFTWTQDKPHVTYLVSLIVGQFETTDVGSRRLPMPVSVPAGSAGDVRGTFGRTPDMVRLFERLLDEPYPWDRYAQVMVWNFAAGGMEHTAATTLFEGACLTREELLDHDMEDLIAHELLHQWFGDLLTCASWEHIWLNEGWATYGEYLWLDHASGEDAALGLAWDWLQSISLDDADAPFQPAMACKEYHHPDDTFGRAADAYAKGGLVLHALRQRLGDDVFWNAVRTYVDRFKHRPVETDDFRIVLEEISGESLERFFAQYVKRPGLPEISLTWSWADGRLTIAANQTQNIDGANPAFDVVLPFAVRLADGSINGELSFDVQSHEIVLYCPEKPLSIAFDPRLASPARLNISQSAEAWADQLTSGPTALARIRAADALANLPEAGLEALLSGLVRSEAQPRRLRLAALEALSAITTDASSLALVGIAPEDPWVRAALIEALGETNLMGDAERESVQPRVLGALSDPSVRVRAAALRSGAMLHAAPILPESRKILVDPSAHEDLHEAGIDALRRVGEPSDVALLLSVCERGYAPGIRAHALRVAAELAGDDATREAAFVAAQQWAFDREVRVADTARELLALSGRPAAREILEAVVRATRDPVRRAAVEALIRQFDSPSPVDGE
jgi:aminopeptidase N